MPPPLCQPHEQLEVARPCLVCDGDLRPAFVKAFDWEGLGRVEYQRCADCGMVASLTHARMSTDEWTRINRAFHARRGPGRSSPERWRQRATGYVDAIGTAHDAGAIPGGRHWLDYACGQGELTAMVERRTHREILRYEPFLPGSGEHWVDAAALDAGSCDLVINTAMFEHVLGRAPLDHLAGLVSDDGVLALHTVVVDQVPDDPTWFYLQPVHCAFFTNAAMTRLCKSWGFQSSAYHIPGRLWLLFRRPLDMLPAALSRPPWAASEGFIAWW